MLWYILAMQLIIRVICEQHAGNKHMFSTEHIHSVESGRQRWWKLQECGSGWLSPRSVVCPEDGGECVCHSAGDIIEHGPSSPILAARLKVSLNYSIYSDL